MDDLAAQFYLTEEDIGKPRAQVSLPKLTELNGYVSVRVAEDALEKEFLQKFSVVVATGMPLAELLRLNELLREIAAERQATRPMPGAFHNMPLVAADVRGVFAYAFSDFGDNFTVIDHNGEQPREMLIEQITQEQEAIVTLVEDSPLKLETGDWVRFNGVQG
jgi:ubiquitin-activating enzyme E1